MGWDGVRMTHHEFIDCYVLDMISLLSACHGFARIRLTNE